MSSLESAIVIHPALKGAGGARAPEARLEEAVGLALAINLDVVDADVVPVTQPRPSTLIGGGKVDDIRARLDSYETRPGLVIVDGALSPVQHRNLEKTWDAKVLDRTALILEIFGERAQTAEGRLQVELAHLDYQRSRLVRSWTHLERQRGGAGFLGGPGERQIESDRRALDDKIVRLKKKLEDVKRTRTLQRARRKRAPHPVVALVGYTNAGKSTLFNRVTGAEVLAKDMLFATLDPTMRRLELTDGPEVILSDTVGFISDLPTELVAAFRATLEEVLAADIILHVRDISHPETENQAKDVHTILGQLGVSDQIPQLEVWNKIDLLEADDIAALHAKAARDDDIFSISAITGEGIDLLLAEVTQRLQGDVTIETLTLPFAAGKERAWLFAENIVEDEVQTDTGFDITVKWTARQAAKFKTL